MSRTRRRIPSTTFRHPKRNIQTKDIAEVRPKAIPPDAYEDKNFCGENVSVYSFVWDMCKRGVSTHRLVEMLIHRYKIGKWDARLLIYRLR